jgi:ParB family chromosome partitioning protein
MATIVIATSYAPNQLYNIPLSELLPDSNQPRKYLDPAAQDELTASVVQHGVLEPVIFRQENGLCYVVAGERRCEAARKAGLSSIPAIFIDSQNYEEISLVENMLRSDLTPVEEAEALLRLQKNHEYKQEDLARMLGKSAPTISVSLSLNKLPQAIRDECRKDPSVPKRVLIDIAAKKQERSMLKASDAYKASVNPQNNPRPGGKVTKAQSAMNAMDAAGRKIAFLDLQSLMPEERGNFTAALAVLKEIIETAQTATKESTAVKTSQGKTTPKAAAPAKKKAGKK